MRFKPGQTIKWNGYIFVIREVAGTSLRCEFLGGPNDGEEFYIRSTTLEPND